MANISVLFGLLLTILGTYGYFGTPTTSITALIPAFAGVPLILLGFLAYQESLRKHMMHAAAMLALLGFLAAVGRAISVAGNWEWKTSTVSLLIMAGLCGVFEALCVKSFIDARRRRQSGD